MFLRDGASRGTPGTMQLVWNDQRDISAHKATVVQSLRWNNVLPRQARDKEKEERGLAHLRLRLSRSISTAPAPPTH
jgi:hypothetical protein